MATSNAATCSMPAGFGLQFLLNRRPTYPVMGPVVPHTKLFRNRAKVHKGRNRQSQMSRETLRGINSQAREINNESRGIGNVCVASTHADSPFGAGAVATSLSAFASNNIRERRRIFNNRRSLAFPRGVYGECGFWTFVMSFACHMDNFSFCEYIRAKAV